MSVKTTYGISFTLVGDGQSKEFVLNLRDNVPPALLSALPPIPPSAIGTWSLIGPDGVQPIPATAELVGNGRTIKVTAESAFEEAGPTFQRYTFTAFLLFETN